MNDDDAAASVLGGDDWVEYAVGNVDFRGRTTIRVASDGEAVVRFEQGDDVSEYEATLDDDALADLRKTLAASDPRTLTPERETAVPDEARVRVEFALDGEEGVLEFWANERHERPPFDALVSAFEAVAADVSDGDVTY